MIRLFEGQQHAGVYKKFRPITYPQVVQTVLDYMETKLPSGGRRYELALDVGCGSGQHTVSLAPHFVTVLGSDISEAQVEEGQRTPGLPTNVRFSVSAGEDLSAVADSSVQLVTGGTSIHWLDLPLFYKEVDRVLVPNGVLAAVSQLYERMVHPGVTDQLNAAVDKFRKDHLDDKWSDKLSYCWSFYRDLPLPYPDQLRIEKMIFTEQKTVADMIGTLASWSAFQTYMKRDAAKATSVMDALQTELLSIMEVDTAPEETPLTMEFRYCFAMSRKPM